MIVRRSISARPPPAVTFEERWGDVERGLVCCWLRGIEKAEEDPALAAAALRGELPPLAWRGGIARPLKAKQRLGSHNYLATWQGLRGEDLVVDTESCPAWTCTRFGVTVTFTGDVARLLSADADEEHAFEGGGGPP